MRHVAAVVCLTVACVASAIAEPRIRPAREVEWTTQQRALAADFAGVFDSGADLRTLLVHPELAKGVLPFAKYILAESTLTPPHRELLILRTAWLTRSQYLWAKHQSRALTAGLSAREIGRLQQRSTSGWDSFEATLITAADELHGSSFISDQTWQALAMRFNVHQLMDATFTVAEMTMLAETLNSVHVDLEPGWKETLDAKGPRPSGNRTHMPLARPRIEPVVLAETTPEIRAMLDPSGSGRDIAAVYRTFARHPQLYPPRQILSEYIRTKATLSPRIRELLILRIGWLCRSEYEWAAHAPAGRRAGLTDDEVRRLARPGYEGWSATDRALVRAVDELYADDTITDDTWSALDAQLDDRQLLDLLITTGGYRMVSMVLNTFGVPAEPNSERFP